MTPCFLSQAALGEEEEEDGEVVVMEEGPGVVDLSLDAEPLAGPGHDRGNG
jgi:hypothetical protein